ncbi:MAG: flagellar basal body-associated FliL family protein [Rhodocyclaceae bacterium]|nr:flagellar basal body-associated FliL family protein [Rhodocyclaceae bacterium]MDZ4215250.1 flagellar basal body-associated FliL family protein [Rhodocyclaceae bacterium]
MADAKKTGAPAEGEAPKKKSKLLLIIIIAVLVLVLGGGGAAFMLMKKKPAEDGDEEDLDAPPAKVAKAKTKKKKGNPGAPPAFVKLDPFVVKLQADGQENYAQATPELKLLEAPMADQVKQFMPEIRHKFLLIMAAKKAADLSNPEGMQQLANQLRESINATLTGEKPDAAMEKQDVNEDGPVVAVFFSSLIVQ